MKYLFSALLSIFMISGVHSQITRPADFTENFNFSSGDPVYLDGSTFFFKAPRPSFWSNWYNVPFEIEAKEEGTYFLSIEGNEPTGFRLFFRGNELYNTSDKIRFSKDEKKNITLNVKNPSYSTNGGTFKLELRKNKLIGSELITTIIVGVASDESPPSASVNALSSTQSSNSFNVSWRANDSHSGVWKYDIQYRINSGSWMNWKSNVTTTSATFSGTYGSTVYFRARAYDNVDNRSEYATGNGDTFTKIQAPTTLSVSPTSLSFDADGGTKSFEVNSNTTWSVSDNQSWISVSGADNNGNDSQVNVTVTSNSSTTSSRSGTVTISGGGLTRTVSISQGRADPPTTLSVSPTSLSFDADGGTKSFEVNSNTTWSVSDNQSWISVSGADNNGNDSQVNVTVTSNSSTTSSRSGTVTISGGGLTRTVSISQGRADPPTTLSVSPTSLSFDADGGTKSFEVNSNTTWSVSDNQSWISVSGADNNGNDSQVNVTVTSNSSTTSSRSGTVTISGGGLTRTVSISQGRADPPTTLSVSPTSLSFDADGGTKSFEVNSNTTWSVSDNQSWISVSGADNNGNDSQVNVTVTSNSSTTSSRSGTVTISGGGLTRTVSISQGRADPPTTLSVSPTSLSFDADGGTKSFEVNSNTTWSVSDNQSWISVSGADNNGNDSQVNVTVTSNSSTTSSRSGTVTISGGGLTRTVSISQGRADPPTTLSVSPTSLSFDADGGTKSFEVNSNTTWSVSDNQSWISVSGADNNGNDSQVNVTVTSNSSTTSSRSGTVTISGGGLTRTVSISQGRADPPTTLSVSPTSLSFDADGGTKSFEVNSNTTWSVSDNQSWISVSGADNNGNDSQVNVTVTSNSSTTSSRSGTVTISGGGLTRTVSISQQGEDIVDIDLVVQAIDHKPDNPLEGNDVDIEVVLHNTGSSSSGSFKWKLFINGTLIDEYTESNINGERSELKTKTVSGLSEGTYIVTVEVDSQEDVSETNEGNNNRNYTFDVGAAPDEKITSLSTNIYQSPNSEFQVDINVGSESDPISDLYGMSYVVTYDPARLEVVEDEKGGFLGSNVTYFPNNDSASGEFAVGITKNGSQSGSNGTGIISSVSFKVNPNISSDTKTTIRLTEIEAENSNQQNIPFSESEVEIDISTGITVWPGDTNNDGKVDQKDVLPIGRYWQQTGPIRPQASSNWEAQMATPWDPEVSTYADANGDGVVNQKDVLPIGRNWQKTHSVNAKALSSVASSAQSGNPPMSLLTDDDVQLNSEFEISVQLGNSDTTLSDVFGSSFVVNYDPEFIEYVSDASGDFLGSSPIYFAQNDSESGSIGVGISRTSGSSSGFGELSLVTFKLIKEVPQESETIISLSEVEVKDVNDDDILVSLNGLIIKGKPSAIVTFSLPDTTALLSNEITLPLTIANPDGGSFSSFQIELDFDQTKLELTNVEKGELLDDNYSVEFNSTPSSDGLISGQGTSDVNTSGNLLHLTFKAVGSGTYGIDFQDILLNEGNPAANSSSGSVNVAPYVCGDTNGDGIVTPSDASDILRHTVLIAPPYPITGVDSSAADVTGNGMITAFDGAQILKFDVKLIAKLNCGLSNQKVEPVFADVDFGEYSEESNKIMVPLTVKGISGDISSLEFSFKLSNGISNISLSNIPESWNLSSNTSGENIYFSLYGTNTVTEDTEFLLSIDKLTNTNGLDLSGDYRINENAKENFVPLFIDEIPNEISLNQNYPNPFNPTTNISFSLPEKAQVKLVIYSTLGQKVAILVDKSVVAGSHTVTWEAQNNASGIYFYRLFVDDVVKTQKMLLIK